MQQNQITETWYAIKSWNGEFFETLEINHAKQALREGGTVFKVTRTVFDSGPSEVRLNVSTEIKKAKDL